MISMEITSIRSEKIDMKLLRGIEGRITNAGIGIDGTVNPHPLIAV